MAVFPSSSVSGVDRSCCTVCIVPTSPLLSPTGNLQTMDDSGAFPQPPLGYSALRRCLRNGLSLQARQTWWPSLPRIPDGDGINSFDNLQELATNRMKWADPDGLSRQLGNSHVAKINFLLQLLHNQFHVFDLTLIAPMTRIVIRDMESVQLAFCVMCDVCERADWFMPTDPAMHRVRLSAFAVLLRRHNAALADQLQQLDALQDAHLNLFFVGLFDELLPEDSVRQLVLVLSFLISNY